PLNPVHSPGAHALPRRWSSPPPSLVNVKGGPMNRLCWHAALLACVLFSGGLAQAQPPDYTETSRYSYNPYTGTTIRSRGYYNPYTGGGGRAVSVTNPYTGDPVEDAAFGNPYTGGPVDRMAYGVRDNRGNSLKTYYNASTGTRLEREVVTDPYTGRVRTSTSG